jgi:signal peptidase I
MKTTPERQGSPVLTRRQRLLKTLRSWVWSFALAFAILMPIRSAIADWNDVPSGSMEPTIMPGERIFVNKMAYGFRVPFTYSWVSQWSDPVAGDIAIFHSPRDGTRLVKRVVAGPGDVVELRDNVLLVNGVPCTYRPLSRVDLQAVKESRPSGWSDGAFAAEQLLGRSHPVLHYPARASLRNFGPLKVPEGEYFMMGDSRDNSADSRVFGCVKRERIVGRGVAVVASLDPERSYIPRWGRWFKPLR